MSNRWSQCWAGLGIWLGADPVKSRGRR